MTNLVLGATGTVGSEVVRQLTQHGHKVRVLTRSAEKAKGFPTGVEVCVGDLASPSWDWSTAWKGVKNVFLLNAVSMQETHEGLMALDACLRFGTEKVVYLSVHEADKAPHIPHFGAKLAIEAAIKASSMNWTILRPNNFFQNDYWMRDAMMQHGVYAQPIGDVGLSRVDVRDIAEAAVTCMTQTGHHGQTYDCVGSELMNGNSTAEIWSASLGKKIQYAGNDLEAFYTNAQQMMPAWMAYDMKIMYAHFQQHGLKSTKESVARFEKLLGHAPRTFSSFATETAKTWK